MQTPHEVANLAGSPILLPGDPRASSNSIGLKLVLIPAGTFLITDGRRL
jgi:hypothetical protein